MLRKANWAGSLTRSPGESRHEVYSGSILNATSGKMAGIIGNIGNFEEIEEQGRSNTERFEYLIDANAIFRGR